MRFVPAAVATTMLVLTSEGMPRAEDEPSLWLPMRDALAISEARKAERAEAPRARPRPLDTLRPQAGALPEQPEFIPDKIHLPDLYEVDYERDAPRFAAPVDSDEMVALELVPGTKRRPSVALSWDEESAPIGDGSDRVSVELELRF